MIVAKTRLRKIPTCCRKCPYYVAEWSNVYQRTDGMCDITKRNTSRIVVSRQRLAECPLIEEQTT